MSDKLNLKNIEEMPDDAFDQYLRESLQTAMSPLKADPEMNNRTKAFIAAEFSKRVAGKKQRRLSFFKMKRAVAAFALVLILLASGLFYGTYTTKVAAISVDINPSIELGLNRYDKVISVDSFNEDGSALLAQLKLQHKNLSEALDMLLLQEQEQAAENEAVIFTVAAEGANAERLMQTVSRFRENYSAKLDASGKKPLKMQAYLAQFDSLSEAHQSNMSLGKFRAYQTLRDCGLELSSEAVQDLSIPEIENLVSEHKRRQHGQQSGKGQNAAGQAGTGNGDSTISGFASQSQNSDSAQHDSENSYGAGSTYRGGKNP